MATTRQIEDYVKGILEDDCKEKKGDHVTISLAKFAGATEAIKYLPTHLAYDHIDASVYGLKTDKPYVEIRGYTERM